MMNPAAEALPAPGPDKPFDLDADEASFPVLLDLKERYGDFCRVHAATRTADSVVIHNVDDIRRVLLSNRYNYVKGVGIERIRVLLGNGLIGSDGDFWARQRRMIQPAFHSRVIRQFSAMMREQTLAFLGRLARAAAASETVNVTRETSEVTLEIVLRSLIGTDLDRLIAASGRNPFELLTHDSLRDLDFAGKFRRLVQPLRGIIAARRNEQRVEPDFLSLLMETRDRETGEGMPERQLIDEIMTLIVAGHETSASALNWTWYLLSQHPDIERAVHEAIAQAPEPEAIGVEDVLRIPFLQQVLKESMRLYPPVWVFSRRAIAEDRLGGFHIPAGTDVFICPYLLHRHAAHWRDPEEFRPARFEAAEDKQRNAFSYLPFSAGPRHCVGEGFAMAEMAMHLAMVARRFRLEYRGVVPPDIEFQINLRTRRDLQMHVIAR